MGPSGSGRAHFNEIKITMMKMSLSRWALAAAAVAAFLLAPVQAGSSNVRTQYSEFCRLLAEWDPTRTQTTVVPAPPPPVPGRWNGLVAGLNSATITVNYSANFDPQARAAFQSAVDIWAMQITSSVPITVTANWTALGAGVLGTAGGQLVQLGGVGVPNTWYPKALLNKLAGSEQFPGTIDITANFNSAFNTRGGWYFGLDGRATSEQWDFKSVVLHELAHGLGFSGSAQDDGSTGSYGLPGSTGTFPVIYDRFTESAARQPILNTSFFPNPSVALHNVYTSEVATDPATGIFWNGAGGVAAAGGGSNRPRLDARPPFTVGSNYSHLSETSYPPGHADSLMTRSLLNGEVIHNPGALTLGIFQDMGWSIPSVPPFGSFDTPAEGSTVSGSIAVTGWALDNATVTKVSIFRDANAGDPAGAVVNNRVFVGDASFVSGARPDIEAAYSAYPNAKRAGWGYLMLTRGLIWDGKGPFRLYAVAFDVEGNQTTLGSKTITVNNATATKPFGSIDTPASGATISGNYPNTGWVLVPGTGVTIPASGVQVYIDTTLVPGTPSTSARADISAGFPGFDTSQAGRGLFIDTTKFTNGTHTIGWLVTASNGQADGIGSRFIQISNGTTQTTARLIDKPVSALPGIDNGAAVRVATTLGANAPQTTVRPDRQGRRRVRIDELGRVAVRSVKGQAAYHVANGELRALPLGATFDAKSGTFFWQTSAGFVGDYEFVVVDEARADARKLTRLMVTVGQSFAPPAPARTTN
jgi:hypothetical protein